MTTSPANESTDTSPGLTTDLSRALATELDAHAERLTGYIADEITPAWNDFVASLRAEFGVVYKVYATDFDATIPWGFVDPAAREEFIRATRSHLEAARKSVESAWASAAADVEAKHRADEAEYERLRIIRSKDS